MKAIEGMHGKVTHYSHACRLRTRKGSFQIKSLPTCINY